MGNKSEFMIGDLARILKNNIHNIKGVEKFEYDSDHLILVQTNEVNNKLARSVQVVKKNKYLYTQQITGRQPSSMVYKKLLELATLFPIEPEETKKTLKSKYK